MDVLDLLQQIEKQQLSKAKSNRDRSSLEKIYHTLEVIDNSISSLVDNNDNKSNNDDSNSIEATIDRMIDDVSTALDDYDNHKISFEISGEQYNKLKKWQNSVDDRLFRYQLETGKLGPGSNTRLFESLLDLLKLTSKQEGKAKPYYGTCGGGYLYKFLPTTIGLITKVENAATKEEIDLTDYESL
jgi:hypothetical protein